MNYMYQYKHTYLPNTPSHTPSQASITTMSFHKGHTPHLRNNNNTSATELDSLTKNMKDKQTCLANVNRNA